MAILTARMLIRLVVRRKFIRLQPYFVVRMVKVFATFQSIAHDFNLLYTASYRNRRLFREWKFLYRVFPVLAEILKHDMSFAPSLSNASGGLDVTYKYLVPTTFKKWIAGFATWSTRFDGASSVYR